jgi:hypothetical protein
MAIPWTPFERRWRDALVGAMIPPTAGARARGVRGVSEVDLSGFWPRLGAAAPFLVRAGFRLAVWVLTWVPAFLPAYAHPFHGLSEPRQDRFLSEAARSRSYLLRQMTLAVKVIACFAYFQDPEARVAVAGEEARR